MTDEKRWKPGRWSGANCISCGTAGSQRSCCEDNPTFCDHCFATRHLPLAHAERFGAIASALGGPSHEMYNCDNPANERPAPQPIESILDDRERLTSDPRFRDENSALRVALCETARAIATMANRDEVLRGNGDPMTIQALTEGALALSQAIETLHRVRLVQSNAILRTEMIHEVAPLVQLATEWLASRGAGPKSEA